MKISFHPKRVRTPQEIDAAKRYREAKNLSAHLETLFSPHDNQSDVDFHRETGHVAGRFTDENLNHHRGYVKQGGTIEVTGEQGEVHHTPYRLHRSDDGRVIRMETLSRDTIKEREIFRTEIDGTVQYEREEPKETMAPASLSFRPGAVDSPEGVAGKEVFDFLNARLKEVSSSILLYDQSESSDLNKSKGEVALLDVAFPGLEPLEVPLSRQYLSNNIAKKAARKEGESELPTDPSFTGYLAEDAGIDATVNWNFGTYSGDWEAVMEAKRSDDKTSAQFDTTLRTPIWETRDYGYYGRETKLKNIKEQVQSIGYSTDENGLISVEFANSTQLLDPPKTQK